MARFGVLCVLVWLTAAAAQQAAPPDTPEPLAAAAASAVETVAADEEPTIAAACSSDSKLGRSSIASPRLFRRACWVYGSLTVATSPLVKPSTVETVLKALRLPLGETLRAILLGACAWLYSIRERYEWYILIWHEAFTSTVADVLAQAIEGPHEDADADANADGHAHAHAHADEQQQQQQQQQQKPPSPSPPSPSPSPLQHEPPVSWRRAARTATVSLMSDDLPFLVWSKLLWEVAEHLKAKVRASVSLSPRMRRWLTHHATVTVAKMAVTQLVYETSSDSAYLAMQAALRGAGLRGVLAELRAKLWTLRKDGLVYWSLAHLALFSIPIWWMQPIADNITTMIFNIYQSFLSHRPLESMR